MTQNDTHTNNADAQRHKTTCVGTRLIASDPAGTTSMPTNNRNDIVNVNCINDADAINRVPTARHNWQYEKLGDICIFERGVTYSKKDETDTPSEVIVLRSNNIDLDTHSLNFNELKYLNANLQIDESKKIKANSILICMSNGSLSHLGKTAFVNKDYNMYFGGFMGLIIPKSQNPKYISYFFRSPIYHRFLESLNRGVNIRNLQFSKLSNLPIPVPPMEVQERIVAELDKINQVIEDCRELLHNLDSLAQSIFYDTFGDPVNNPKGWDKIKFEELCKLSAGGDKPADTQKEISTEIKIPVYSNGIENEGLYGYTSKPRITEPSLTISGRGTLGVPFIRTCPFVPIIRLIVATPYSKMNLIFLYYLIKIRRLGGKGAAIPQLTVPMVKNILLPVPPLPLQQEFAERVEKIEAQKKAVEDTITEMQTLLDSRMDYWFN